MMALAALGFVPQLSISHTLADRLTNIAALAVLLALQTVWQRRVGAKAMDSRVNDLRTAINANRDIATQEFAEVTRGMDGLGHRIDLWTEKTDALKDSVKGLLSREQTRLEDDAKLIRRRRR